MDESKLSKIPKKVKAALQIKSNIRFLHSLFLIEPGTHKQLRLKVLGRGNQKQRKLLIVVLHLIMTGAIPMRKVDFPKIRSKLVFLKEHFEDEAAVKKLLASSDSEQKKLLSSVTNFHVLLHSMMT
jgi:hypothetical protein